MLTECSNIRQSPLKLGLSVTGQLSRLVRSISQGLVSSDQGFFTARSARIASAEDVWWPSDSIEVALTDHEINITSLGEP